jgi:ADP-heptose:LPS heptosyltransferase
MQVDTMRRADRWIGTPACAGLSALRSVFGKRRPDPEPLEKILIVKLAEQGSTVLAYPALKRAVELVGPDGVYFLAFTENRFILDVMEIIPPENVIEVDSKSFTTVAKSSLGAIRRMRRLKLDAAVDMEFFARSSALFTWLSGARMRVGFHSFSGEGPYRGDLMTHRPLYNPHLHTSQIFYSMVEALKHPAELNPALAVKPPPLSEMEIPTFTPRDDEVEEVSKLICDLTGEPEVGPVVLLNANCSDLLPLRLWDRQNYVLLARLLLEKYPDVRIAFTGAPNEAPEVEKLLAQIDSPRAVCLAGRTTLRQLLVAYSLSELLVTNDSGPAHFATLTPIDVITLFGPETPKLFGSTSPRAHVMWSGLFCSPCVSAYNNRFSTCQDNLCMKSITVEAVFAKACEVLDRRLG